MPVLATIGAAALDLLFGGSCSGCDRAGRAVCPGCRVLLAAAPFVAWPTPSPVGLALPYAVADYSGPVRRLVIDHKENSRLALTLPLASALTLSLLAALAQTALPEPSQVPLVVPAPSTPRTVRARGHDPVLRMSRLAARSLRRHGVMVRVAPALRVVRAVADQAGLGAQDRARNLSGAYAEAPRWQHELRGRTVVLTDDVITTGATAAEGCRALEQAGARVAAVALIAATKRIVADGETFPTRLS